MTRKIVIRFDGFEYVGSDVSHVDGKLSVNSGALAELLITRPATATKGTSLTPAGLGIADFDLDENGRVLLRNPTLLQSLSNALATGANSGDSYTNDYCSQISNGQCSVTNTACD